MKILANFHWSNAILYFGQVTIRAKFFNIQQKLKTSKLPGSFLSAQGLIVSNLAENRGIFSSWPNAERESDALYTHPVDFKLQELDFPCANLVHSVETSQNLSNYRAVILNWRVCGNDY